MPQTRHGGATRAWEPAVTRHHSLLAAVTDDVISELLALADQAYHEGDRATAEVLIDLIYGKFEARNGAARPR